MKMMRNCRDVTHLVIEGQDRALSLRERLAVRVHMMVCKACPNFEAQMGLMRGAMQRWRQYAETSESDTPPPGRP